MANYTFGKAIPDVENGHTFSHDNFTQLLPHTKILEGKSGITFFKCTLVNCDPPADSVFISCRPKQADLCTNLNPKLITYGLTACEANCRHVTSVDEVIIDGILVDTVYQYSNKVAE